MSVDRTIHHLVWIPFKHPITGLRMNLLCNYNDHMIDQEQAEELHEQYNLPSAQGSMRMDVDGTIEVD